MGNELANKTAKNVINIYFWYIFFCFAAAVAASIFVVVFFIFGYILVILNGRVFPSIFGFSLSLSGAQLYLFLLVALLVRLCVKYV